MANILPDNSIEITIEELTVEKINKILEAGATLKLSDVAKHRIQKCRYYLDQKMTEKDKVFYGINTGFGSLCNTVVSNEDLSKLQENLVKSHACGMGRESSNQIVKLMLLLKIQGLSYGHSGIAVATVQRLIDFYNNDVLPIVYEQGSLGASGDLSPLAHMSLALLGLGEVNHKGKRRLAKDVLNEYKWKPITLQSKEGLALLNGTQFMSAHGVLALMKAKQILKMSNLVASVSIDAYDGRIQPFLDNVHIVRNHKGQLYTARVIRENLEGSELIAQYKVNVQDPYSFRCIPQVHGATKDAVDYVTTVIETEINSVTDNPTIFPDEDLVVSAGNFHGQPLALVLDHLTIAIAELASIAERRVVKLISGTRDLPPFLVANPGLNSGFMIPQYTAASIVSKNKQLCTPCSVDTIDSSNGQEDHVSMGANAATKLLEVVTNVESVIAIELFTAAQALEFRRPKKSSIIIEQMLKTYRKKVPFITDDIVMQTKMHQSAEFIREYKRNF